VSECFGEKRAEGSRIEGKVVTINFIENLERRNKDILFQRELGNIREGTGHKGPGSAGRKQLAANQMRGVRASRKKRRQVLEVAI